MAKRFRPMKLKLREFHPILKYWISEFRSSGDGGKQLNQNSAA
jgi:hypothetical protein